MGWSSLCGRRQAVSTSLSLGLCVQPKMLSLLGCEPHEGSCVITSCTVVMGVDSGARQC